VFTLYLLYLLYLLYRRLNVRRLHAYATATASGCTGCMHRVQRPPCLPLLSLPLPMHPLLSHLQGDLGCLQVHLDLLQLLYRCIDV
jgi:hypothetical protein